MIFSGLYFSKKESIFANTSYSAPSISIFIALILVKL